MQVFTINEIQHTYGIRDKQTDKSQEEIYKMIERVHEIYIKRDEYYMKICS